MKVKTMALKGKNLPRGKIPITFVLGKCNIHNPTMSLAGTSTGDTAFTGASLIISKGGSCWLNVLLKITNH